ncbi:trypsin-like peptidase domain-containing protein [Paracoccaceae bacterium Fryx2]|nr:trypsin-like peptidase domain-containing protein [Paracoccaceae bacterium Fryx2]
MTRAIATLFLAALCLAQPLAGAVRAEARVPGSQAEIAFGFAPVVRAAAPAVVNIYASRVVQERRSRFAADPFFDQFFGDFGQTTPRVQNSLGSGVIVSADGVVVSNYHVVGEATDIRVVLNDRREFTAQVLLADEESDLAVLQLDGAAGLPALALRDSDGLEVGELVLAIGNPFGIGQTVSSGIVSGLARSALPIGGGRGYFIQTDAAINPGNSGGALVDVAGRLVGINTAILSKSGGSLGIGFAIPANLVRTFLEQAAVGQTRFQRPWAGASGQPVDAALAEAMGLDRPEGVVLTELHPESPFRKAGLQPGDVVLSLDQGRTDTPQEMLFRMSTIGVGKTAQLTYRRGIRDATAEVALISAPEIPARDALTITGDVVLRGLSVARINPAVAAELNLPMTAEGVVVTAVAEMAARTGLLPGDILLALDGAPVATTANVAAAAASRQRGWTIDVLRSGARLRLRFRF